MSLTKTGERNNCFMRNREVMKPRRRGNKGKNRAITRGEG